MSEVGYHSRLHLPCSEDNSQKMSKKTHSKLQMDWEATDLRREWTRFKHHCQFTFKGPLAYKSKDELVNYLMTYVGDKVVKSTPMFTFADGKAVKLELVYRKFREYVEPKHDVIQAMVKFNRHC